MAKLQPPRLELKFRLIAQANLKSAYSFSPEINFRADPHKYLKRLKTNQPKEVILDSKSTARLIVDAAAEKKAANILMLDVKELTTLADYFVICEGTSERQLNAIHEGILEELKESEINTYHKEGTPKSGWILLDYGYVLVHIFSPERRAYYQLEELWRDAPTVMKML